MDDIVDINLYLQDYLEAERHVRVQPIIQFKQENTCVCASDEYWRGLVSTCSPDYWNFQSHIPGDLMAEFWIKKGFLPDCAACAEGQPCKLIQH